MLAFYFADFANAFKLQKLMEQNYSNSYFSCMNNTGKKHENLKSQTLREWKNEIFKNSEFGSSKCKEFYSTAIAIYYKI